jgi:hypothetical protein
MIAPYRELNQNEIFADWNRPVDMLGKEIGIGDEIVMPGRSSSRCWLSIYRVRGLGIDCITAECIEAGGRMTQLGRKVTLTAANRKCLILKKAKWPTNVV